MISISKSRDVRASIDWVWGIMSNTDDDEKYWNAIREVRVIRRGENTIEREASVGPSAFSHRSLQTITLDPKKSIKLTMNGNPMEGERTIVLVPLGKNSTRIDVEWRFELKDVPGFVGSLVKGQILRATDGALTKIAEQAERAAESSEEGAGP